MARTNPTWNVEADELLDLEYLAHGNGTQIDENGAVIEHPSMPRQFMSVDEKLYQPGGETEATAYENLSLGEVLDDTDTGFDRWDY